MPTHRRRASAWHEPCRLTTDSVELSRAMSDHDGTRRPGTPTAPTRRSAVKSRDAHDVHIRRDSPFRVKSALDSSRAEHLPWRSNDVRTSCEIDSRRPRGAGFRSSRDGLERWSKGGGGKSRKTGP